MFQMFQERVLPHRRCTTDCAQERALTKNEQNAALLMQQRRPMRRRSDGASVLRSDITSNIKVQLKRGVSTHSVTKEDYLKMKN
jgi:hypothetical protein